jgi:hypothetical protein
MDSLITLTDSEFDSFADIVYNSTRVNIGMSKVHGRGVMATETILANELIERFPLVPCAFRVRYHGDPMILSSTLIHTTCPCDQCKEHGWKMYLQGGCGMFYNHQDTNNAVVRVNWDMLYAEVKSITTIPQGKEVYVDYGSNYPWELSGMEKVTIESSEKTL